MMARLTTALRHNDDEPETPDEDEDEWDDTDDDDDGDEGEYDLSDEGDEIERWASQAAYDPRYQTDWGDA